MISRTDIRFFSLLRADIRNNSVLDLVQNQMTSLFDKCQNEHMSIPIQWKTLDGEENLWENVFIINLRLDLLENLSWVQMNSW